MATVFDVAVYLLEKNGPMPAMMLQKLCYYAQAWSLVWDSKPLYSERIEAWANGPVVPDLFRLHKGLFSVPSLSHGNSKNLSAGEKETIDSVYDFYIKYNSQQLSDLTHLEAPWRKAREGVPPGEPSNNVIGLDQMHAYYSSISNI